MVCAGLVLLSAYACILMFLHGTFVMHAGGIAAGLL